MNCRFLYRLFFVSFFIILIVIVPPSAASTPAMRCGLLLGNLVEDEHNEKIYLTAKTQEDLFRNMSELTRGKDTLAYYEEHPVTQKNETWRIDVTDLLPPVVQQIFSKASSDTNCFNACIRFHNPNFADRFMNQPDFFDSLQRDFVQFPQWTPPEFGDILVYWIPFEKGLESLPLETTVKAVAIHANIFLSPEQRFEKQGPQFPYRIPTNRSIQPIDGISKLAIFRWKHPLNKK